MPQKIWECKQKLPGCCEFWCAQDLSLKQFFVDVCLQWECWCYLNSSTFWKHNTWNFNGKMLVFHCFKFLAVLLSYHFHWLEVMFCLNLWSRGIFSLPSLKKRKQLHNCLGKNTERKGPNVFLIRALFFHGGTSK